MNPINGPYEGPIVITRTGKGFFSIDPEKEDLFIPGENLGAVINKASQERIEKYITEAEQQGAKVLVDGRHTTVKGKEKGTYVGPTVIDHVKPEMSVATEEIFGPVAAVIRVRDYDEALSVANATPYGLSAGIVTTSLKYATHFKRNTESGLAMVNLTTAGLNYHVPFGGTRKSSYGAREQGFAALEFYTQTKTVYIGD